MKSGNRNGSRRGNQNSSAYFDYSLLFITIFMVCFGLVMLYSASSYESAMEFGDSKHYLISQLQAVIIGVVLMIIVIKLDYHFYKKPIIALLAYFASMGLGLLVLSPIGISANGARRWIGLGGFSVQVCEVIKIGLIMFMAFVIERKSRQLKNIGTFALCMFFVIIPAAVVAFVTIDLSSAVVVGAIGVIMLLIACPRFSYFIAMAAAAVGMFALAIAIEPYRLERIEVWLNPEKYADEGGFQVLQSLYSLGSGGLFGKGLGKGIQKLGYVPEAQNDMIFTVICEELGVVGGIAVILMFIFMIWRFMIISNNAPDLYGSLLVVGVMAHISVQTIMNIAVVTNTMPNTGVTLPFMSYGGSSIMCLLVEIGIVLSVSRRIRFE
ncbi:MAG: cell division protein FtsW [Lachnospiraceae bacterium]|nr:cell division protein FtsW [Lachnospiraceae bacterium]